MRDNRPTIVCIATNGFHRLWLDCIESQKRYAERYGFYHHLLTTNPNPDLTPYWSKVQVCIDILSTGRDVLLIDSDAYIRETTPRFTDLINEHSDHDIFIANGSSGRPNSGVVIFRGGNESMSTRFLDECLSNKDIIIPVEDRVTLGDRITEYGENGHFIHFLKKTNFAEKTKILDERWNKIVPPALPDDFIIHYTGPMRRRGGAMDGCISFLRGTGACRSLGFFDRLSREYYRVRWLLVKIANRIPLFGRLLNFIADLLIGRSDTTPMTTPFSSAGAVWKFEYSLSLLEHPTTLVARQILGPGDVAVDGGAHVGYFTRQFASATGSSGRIVAIEAHPENAARLRSNMRDLQVTVIENAITEEARDVYLHSGGGHSNHSLVELTGIHTTRLTVAGRRLDDILSSLDIATVDLIKLDIEGFEIDALRSLGTYLSEGRIRYILIEISPDILERRGMDAEMISALLYDNGFILREIRDDYTFGPRGFINTRTTQNYIAANEIGWTYLFNRISLHRK
ncbi:FkbM family methyltransferase [Ancylobacter sp. IITR112]|uniref:FkbM family methyltransferase n=1 Tax=Ancylobacter sp. IITR112 TaxID=3138073 RepID=UPI00352A23EB